MASTASDWQFYPEHRTDLLPDAHDRAWYRQRLGKDAARLFSSDEAHLELVIRDIKSNTVTTHLVDSMPAMDRALALCQQNSVEILFIMRQWSSWERIISTISISCRLFAFFDIFPQFLDHLHSFGFRVDGTGEDFSGFSKQTQNPRNNLTEMCYNTRYPEENGRSTGEPWSIRHTAVYYQYNASNHCHMMLLVQPSDGLRTQIRHLLASSGPSLLSFPTIQLATFLSPNRFWKDYLIYLEKELIVMENKACFSKVGVKSNHNDNLVFKDSQNLQRVRKKLLKAQEIIESSIHVSTKYRLNSTCQVATGSGDLESLIFQLENSQLAVNRLLQISNGISDLFFKILKYRNDEKANTTINAIDQTGRVMAELVTASNQGTQALAKLTSNAQRDSRATKILTTVASLYLPATLVASVFNSNLVQTVSTNEKSGNSGGGYFVASSGFWMFPVFTVVLMVATLLPAGLWVRYTATKARGVELHEMLHLH